jgi:hypothetical protein
VPLSRGAATARLDRSPRRRPPGRPPRGPGTARREPLAPRTRPDRGGPGAEVPGPSRRRRRAGHRAPRARAAGERVAPGTAALDRARWRSPEAARDSFVSAPPASCRHRASAPSSGRACARPRRHRRQGRGRRSLRPAPAPASRTAPCSAPRAGPSVRPPARDTGSSSPDRPDGVRAARRRGRGHDGRRPAASHRWTGRHRPRGRCGPLVGPAGAPAAAGRDRHPGPRRRAARHRSTAIAPGGPHRGQAPPARRPRDRRSRGPWRRRGHARRP